MRRGVLVTVVIILLLVSNIGFIMAWQKASKSSEQSQNVSKYPLLSRRFLLNSPNDVIVNFVGLRNSVTAYFDNLGLKHSFYFEYLPSGVSVRHGQDNELAAASLMKLPLIMDLYRLSEQNKVNLDTESEVTEADLSSDTIFGNTEDLKVGQMLTLRKAAEITLVHSDNTAARFVNRHIADLLVQQDKALSFLDLPVTTQETDQGDYVTISAKNYSSVLSCLYLSCLLQPEHSQEILDSLSHSKNTSRLPAGVPDDVTVANKLGSFSDESQSDCGIVYVPNRPYLFCMMIFSPAENIDDNFRDVSKMVYDYVHTSTSPLVTKK